MNTFKAEVNKIILALTSLGIVILLMFPVSLSANHFRYGTMSWELVSDNGTHITIRLKMQNGWTANHSHFLEDGTSPYDTYVSGYIGSIKNDYITINWNDGTTSDVDIKILSRDNTTGTASTTCGSSTNQSLDRCKDSTISEMGEYVSSTWTTGVTHTYPDNGTTEYVVHWGDSARRPTENYPSSSVEWRNETKVTIGGAYDNNTSPVSAVPPIVQVQDNTTFTYQVISSDTTGDNLAYRWGKLNEFFQTDGSGSIATFTNPTGMTLSSNGLITWDVRDSVLCSGCSSQNDVNDAEDLWVLTMMVEDSFDNGSVKSYIPIDFFFRTTAASNPPATLSGIPNETQIVSVGNTKTITIKSIDTSGVAPTITVLNPPSDNSSIWSTTSSSAIEDGDNTTTFTITFTPNSSMAGNTSVISVRSTDNAGMTKDQSFGIQVSSVSNADPTAPTLISPANGDNVTSPVTFRFAASTDSDGDSVSYTMYVCDNSGFVGCSGTSVTAGGNFVPPFNQNFHDNLIPWPSPLHAATSSQQISQDLSMIPKLFILLGVLGLLSVIISLSVKNITHRRILYVLFLIIIGTVSCSTSSSNEDELDEENTSTDTTDNTTSTDTTAPTVSSVSTTADDQSSVSVTDNITVTFSEAMDTTYVTTSTSDTNCAGTIRVSPDNFSTCVRMSSEPVSSNSNTTFTLDPYDNLTRLTTYLTRVTTGVKDTAGNAMGSQYETSSGFTTDNSSINVSNSGLADGTTYSNGTTYYWKVVASDPKGGSAQSETWSFTVQE